VCLYVCVVPVELCVIMKGLCADPQYMIRQHKTQQLQLQWGTLFDMHGLEVGDP